jgi:superfamily I DNA/RNA helicase/Txe/YoeB family toxin of Txe-Axe toxin-antitoxin module
MGVFNAHKEVVVGRSRGGDHRELALGRLTRMAITRQFVDAYRATTTDRYVVTRVQECIDDLWTFPRPRGLNVEMLGGSGRHRFWSARVDQNWRIIFLVPRAEEVILVHVASHDRAYAWVDTHVRQAERLGTQASTLDPDMKVSDAVLAFGLPSAEETARAVQSASEFAAMCERGLETYFTTLDPSQQDLVEMNPVGNFLALGGPGTGKTVIAIHRVVRHLRERNRVAYVCFNRPLFQATQEMIEALAPNALERLGYIGTMHDLCLRIIEASGRSQSKPAPPELFEAKVDDSIRNLPANLKRAVLTTKTTADNGRSALWRARDVTEEIRQVIMACHVKSLDEYLAMDRSWRGGQVTSDARRAVWSIYEASTAALGAEGLIAWDDLTQQAANALATQGASILPFSEIIIDEIQDIAPGFIEVARLLVAPAGGRIFALGDPEQVLYGRPIKLALDRVTPHRHDRRWLARDYRSTRQTWRLAERWRVIERDAETIRESEIAPTRIGPVPRLVVESDSAAALDALVEAVVEASRTTNLGLIGVLHLGAEIGKKIADALNARGVDAVLVDGKYEAKFADPVVKIVSMRRSKGLDFPSLFVLIPDRQDASRDPITWADRELSVEARRVLYVAATRASRGLALVTGIAAPHPLLLELDHSSYRAEGSRGGEWRRRFGGEDPEDPLPRVTPRDSVADVGVSG